MRSTPWITTCEKGVARAEERAVTDPYYAARDLKWWKRRLFWARYGIYFYGVVGGTIGSTVGAVIGWAIAEAVQS